MKLLCAALVIPEQCHDQTDLGRRKVTLKILVAAWADAKGNENRHALGKRGHILNLSLHFNPPLSQAKRAIDAIGSIDGGSSK